MNTLKNPNKKPVGKKDVVTSVTGKRLKSGKPVAKPAPPAPLPSPKPVKPGKRGKIVSMPGKTTPMPIKPGKPVRMPKKGVVTSVTGKRLKQPGKPVPMSRNR